jgi:hypothetical protein
MGEYSTFIITLLVEEWVTNGEKFGPTIVKWILKCKISEVQGEWGWDSKKVMQKLVERQPQAAGQKILEIEESNIHIA